jgi:hypothetical protein
MRPSLVAAATLFTLGCSGSVLIRPGDQTFARSRARYHRTQKLVAAQAPDAPEAPLFMQAEAMYRYRFDPPARSFGNYLAQTLAVATEFAPLQALAASAGMFELRLRTYDGAVQLWETMLAMHPDTRLEPLTLYRLGWAYRSVATDGFPRDDGDEAWDQLIAKYPTSPLADTAKQARAVAWKSQDMALALSIVPGAGQMYSGEYTNGAVRLAAALACAALIVTPLYLAYHEYERGDLDWPDDWPYIAIPFGGIILLNVVYTTAYQDALRAAVEWNERAEAAFDHAHPEAP